MSDTPRTDGCLTEILDAYGYVHQGNCPQRWVNHARELERELNAATSEVDRLRKANLQLREGDEEQKQRIKRLEEFIDQLTNPKFTRDDLPKEALLQYIKRLEEAGDDVAAIIGPPGSAHWADENQVDAAWNNWRKAKEAKP